MCAGISLAVSEVPQEAMEAHRLHRRLIERGGEPEVRFLSRDLPRLLPVWHEGRLRVVRWGTRRAESRTLRPTGWTWLATVESGGWAALGPEPVLIPASMGLEGGVWFRIRQGVRGLLVRDERGREAVYMLVEPASHYYQVMTRSPRMPVLVGERY